MSRWKKRDVIACRFDQVSAGDSSVPIQTTVWKTAMMIMMMMVMVMDQENDKDDENK